ncbi:MAG: molybdopterin oxidoreductase [Alcaligenaceae bacterium]|nr:molybdopterin oxidoreductase [Alcaligenaceae bacterium]
MRQDALLNQYLNHAGHYNELLDQHGAVRPHWAPLVRQLEGFAENSFQEPIDLVAERLRSFGLSYNAYSEVEGLYQPWRLSLVPVAIEQDEWATIAGAIAQRAKLLDYILSDIYGEQQLLSNSDIPAALVLGQKGYLWPCQYLLPTHAPKLHLYAADIARCADGRWKLIADYTQDCRGAGFALQNRQIVAPILAEAFSASHVRHQTAFYETLQQTLKHYAANRADNPIVVLLSPGPEHDLYFEHAYLSSQLGFPLVESADLTVRDDFLYMKTLRGLRKVHVVLRCMNDRECDPMELDAGSMLGVPGLVHAIRQGNLIMANALGSGVLESPGLQAYLPGLCSNVLGEPLKMPSVQTWWCGDAGSLDYVLAHLNDLVIKPAFTGMTQDTVWVGALSQKEQQSLRESIKAQPQAYVAHEALDLALTPDIAEAGSVSLDAYPYLVRVFAVARPDGSYAVMPGGIAHVGYDRSQTLLSRRNQGASKDVWVTQVSLSAKKGRSNGEGPDPADAQIASDLSLEDLLASHVDVSARVGDNLFWMGRYGARCEHVVRSLQLLAGLVGNDTQIDQQKVALVHKLCEQMFIMQAGPTAHHPMHGALELLRAAISQSDAVESLVNNVYRLYFCGWNVKERLSQDNWLVISKMRNSVAVMPRSLPAVQSHLDNLALMCASLGGFVHEQMTRDDGWSFLELGRVVERLRHAGQVMAYFLQLPSAEQKIFEGSALRLLNSVVTYRARYRREPELLSVIYITLFDPTNPHSLKYQCEKIRSRLNDFELNGGQSVALSDTLGEQLQSFDLGQFVAPQVNHRLVCERLVGLCELAQKLVDTLTRDISRQYFLLADHYHDNDVVDVPGEEAS